MYVCVLLTTRQLVASPSPSLGWAVVPSCPLVVAQSLWLPSLWGPLPWNSRPPVCPPSPWDQAELCKACLGKALGLIPLELPSGLPRGVGPVVST